MPAAAHGGRLTQLDDEIRRARQHLADLERARRAAIAEAAVHGGRLREGDLVEFRRQGVGTFQAEVVTIDPARPRSVKLRYRGAGKSRRPISKPDVWVSAGRISRVLAYAAESTTGPSLAVARDATGPGDREAAAAGQISRKTLLSKP